MHSANDRPALVRCNVRAMRIAPRVQSTWLHRSANSSPSLAPLAIATWNRAARRSGRAASRNAGICSRVRMRISPRGSRGGRVRRAAFLATRPLTSVGDDLLALAAERQAAGSPLGMSIGYGVRDYAYDSARRRRIKSLRLGEYSFVAMPANANARILAVKSAESVTDADRAIANVEMMIIEEWVRREKQRMGMS